MVQMVSSSSSSGQMLFLTEASAPMLWSHGPSCWKWAEWEEEGSEELLQVEEPQEGQGGTGLAGERRSKSHV